MSQRDRIIPDDPLGFVRRCVREQKVLWTYHVNMRLEKRFIPRSWILESAASFELLEPYPEDKYLPSYLMYSQFESVVFHVLFATDVAGGTVRVVTAYRPDPAEWEEDLRTRRSIR